MHRVKEEIAILLSYYYRYPLLTNKHKFNIYTDEETIRRIVAERLSVSRFGDGEYGMIGGGEIGFQDKNDDLSNRLKEVLLKQEQGHLNCIPLFLNTTSGLTRHVAKYCRAYYCNHLSHIIQNTPKNAIYGSQGFTRFYADFSDKSAEIMRKKVDLIRSIWENRDVYLVEGEFSRCGVGNDLFENAKSLHRIICPAVNAFDKYDEILNTVKVTVPKEGSLILCVLGPTATVLAYDLFFFGYQAIDMGHVDIEYEWFKKGTKGKENVPGKAVNERGGNRPINPIATDDYYRQIVVSLV